MKRAMSILEQSPYLRIDYLSLVDEENLNVVESIADNSANYILAFAGFYDSVRLIDHVTLSVKPND
jgi:pantothenate synthetase